MTRRDLLRGAAVGTIALALGGLASGASAQGRVHTIVMANMRFGPVPAGIKAGDVIVWVNRDMVPHTATARDGSFNLNVPAHQSGRMRVPHAGNFAVYCRFHPTMRTTLSASR